MRSAGFVMEKPSVEDALRWMLAAWTLWASVFASPTVVHSHSEGGRPHQHDRSDCPVNGLSHSALPAAGQGDCDRGMSLSATESHRHGFILLLGVEYLPISGEPTGPQGKSLCGWETIIAVSAAQGIRAHSNG